MLVRLLLLLLLSLVTCSSLKAHELSPAIADISIQHAAGSYSYSAQARIRINLESLIADIGADHDDTNDSPNSARYQQLRALSPAQLADASQQFQKTMSDSLSILSDKGRRVPVLITKLEIDTLDDIELVRDSWLDITFGFKPDESGFTWSWPQRFGDIIVRTESRSDELDYAALLSAGSRSEMITLGSVTQISSATTFFNYLLIGFQHIIPKGLDHILFIIGIFLISPYWKTLFIQITTFTVAHSITLALTILGYISFPATIIEPLIALSIVYVCIENIFFQKVRRMRIALVFLFGLLHGMGFASVLAEVGLQPQQLVLALLSFNIGVELGQLAIIACCVLLIGLWFRNKTWYRERVSIPLSVLIAVVGCYWFLQRLIPLLPNI